MAITTIIFDYYDTLVVSGIKKFLIENDFDWNGPEIVAINNLSDSAQITVPEYYERLSKIVNTPAETLESINTKVVNQPLMDYIRTNLLGKYRLAILSNIGGATSITKRLSSDDIAMFEYIGMSYATGFLKPDERAYLDVTEHLGVSANECVFIDDRPQYCAAADKLGMKTILYTNFDGCKEKLNKILGQQRAEGDNR